MTKTHYSYRKHLPIRYTYYSIDDPPFKHPEYSPKISIPSIQDHDIPSETVEPSSSINPEYHEVDNISEPIISDDPAKWIVNNTTIDNLLQRGIKQNANADFSLSKRVICNQVRSMSKSLFTRTLKNGDTQLRSWLVYSESKLCVFCAPCLLFDKESQSAFKNGLNDWNNIHKRVQDHENSFQDQRLQRKQKTDCFDLNKQIETEVEYWRNVLKRVVVVIKNLSSRGLPFRGSDERFGSLHNGNYMMLLEIIAEFDPFLAEHIKSYGNKGKGSVSYLSSTICDEFIQIMSAELLKKIIAEVKEAKYYSMSADSTPDISHIDQLTFILRYITKGGVPKERFIKFIPNCGHKSENLFDALINILNELDLNVNNCRGQSYDNASNMSGAYSGLQARIKAVNPLADFIPCSAHSLNLVGTYAAECCTIATNFFSLIQKLYNFFSASPGRWNILMSRLSCQVTLKSLFETRWSARHDAVNALCLSWNEILSALEDISEDTREKALTTSEASGILTNLNSLEYCFLALLWNDILDRFNKVSKILQSTNTDLPTVVELYQSLIKYIESMRTNFENYEKQAIEKSKIKEYACNIVRHRKRKIHFDDELNENDLNPLSGSDNMRINVFYVILDLLLADLNRRNKCYVDLNNKFGFLTSLHELSPEMITTKALKLQSYYPDDLEISLDIECRHLAAHLKSLNIGKMSALKLCEKLHDEHFVILYPNVNIALRIYLCMMVTNCSGERTFSVLQRVKNHLRNSQTNERLNALSLLCIEAELNRDMDYNHIIDEFAIKKARKVHL
ncbi:Zinc finger MYM-type protein 1 [Cyphomyrmex costatus]|uniref:Zinc finger MYM-type protein 1 n=1 Tax=Cyphomyrmex costatus TaxID=456900 RepID=A0A151IFY8_9HYME|nr:Zinc finger MYM-type protein 1 [Cyphomyrmex costatus]